MSKSARDIQVNDIFGKWKVLSQAESKGEQKYWNCKCSCGNIQSVRGISLVAERSAKCMKCSRAENGIKRIRDDFHVASGAVLQQYKRNAKIRKIEFKLTKDELKSIIIKDCYYCGALPSVYNGIDRLDNSKGYVLDNCVPCCFNCNWAKSDMTVEQFKNWIKRIYVNQFKKVTDLTPGQLIDSLFTVDTKCWFAQEKIGDITLTDSERLLAATQAQEYNAKRNKIMQAIDAVLDFTNNTHTHKTYDKPN